MSTSYRKHYLALVALLVGVLCTFIILNGGSHSLVMMSQDDQRRMQLQREGMSELYEVLKDVFE